MRKQDKEWALAMIVHFRAEHGNVVEILKQATERVANLENHVSRLEVLIRDCDKPLPPREKPPKGVQG